MEWTDIRLTVAHKDAEQAEAAATMIAEGGIYIEDYSDIEQQVAEIAHVDLIEPELLEKPRDVSHHPHLPRAGDPAGRDAGRHRRPDGRRRHPLHGGDRRRRAGGLAERLAQILSPAGDRPPAGGGALLAELRHRPRSS